MQEQDGVDEFEFAGSDGRRLVAGFAVLALLGTAFFGTRLFREFTDGETNHAAETGPGASAIKPLEVTAFATRIESGGAFVVSVDSDGESIPGTDIVVASADIGNHPRLPSDKRAPILVYGHSSGSGMAAANALRDDGYRRVDFLSGGAKAWRAAGRPFKLDDSQPAA